MERSTRPIWAVVSLLFVLCCLSIPAETSVVYVNKNAPGPVHDGRSWATAFTAIQPAADAAAPGDEVWVGANASGYEESIEFAKDLSLFGGFTGAETTRDQRDWRAHPTVVKGTSSTSGLTVDGNAVTVDGFCITGHVNGAVVVWAKSATLANNLISGNASGVCTYGCNIVLINNVNSSSSGVGLWVHQGSGTISNNVIVGNGWTGAGLAECNVASFTNNTIVGNAAVGVSIYGATATLANNIVAFNARTGIEEETGAESLLELSHNDVFGNAWGDYAYVAPQARRDDISAEPTLADFASGDYRLLRGSPCIDTGNDSAVTPHETDLGGNRRISGSHVDIGAYEWQWPSPWSVHLDAAAAGGVTVAEKVAYVAGNDGKLYGRSTVDGSAVAGFPVDVSAAVGATVKLPSRPAVYYGKTGKAIYLTTDRGDVVRVLPDGTVSWHVRPLTGQTVSTPAATPDGNVFVNLSTGSGPFNNYVFKLDEATGTPLSLSPFLGYTTADNIGDLSPAANSRYLYVNAGWGSKSGLTLLNQDNLTVRSSFAGGEQCLSPLLIGSDLLLASKSGKAWKMNSVTLAPDLGFGHFGVADLGTQISAAPFSDAAGNVYIGTADGRILKWTPGTGAFMPFHTATGKVAGLTINRKAGVLGFGTSTGSFVQVPLDSPTSASTISSDGPISTGTVYESLTDRFIVVTDTGILSGYPSIR